MSFSHNVDLGWSKDNATSNQRVTLTADGETNRSVAVADGQTAQRIQASVTRDGLKSLFWKSDQTLTIEANSSDTPNKTFALEAGKPFVWFDGCGHTNPFTESDGDPFDLTDLYVANASGEAATLELYMLHDATP